MNRKNPTCIALIPARSGSKRVKNKNILSLASHPLIAYSIISALQSNIFNRVIVSTDSGKIAKIARYYGAEVPFLRPVKYAQDKSPDIEWVSFTLNRLHKTGNEYDCFSILRPTSPLRSYETIKRAWREFTSDGKADSLRAVEKCKQHPAKMWTIKDNRTYPIIKNPNKKGVAWHSSPYQSLPEIYVQNASLEIAWCDLPLKNNSISGYKIMPFFTNNYEGYDINDLKDLLYLEYLISKKKAVLPSIKVKPYKKS